MQPPNEMSSFLDMINDSMRQQQANNPQIVAAKAALDRKIAPYGVNNPRMYIDYPPRPSYGSGQCVALVMELARMPVGVGGWRPGARVRDVDIPVGAAIATFDSQGRYPNWDHGNHAAIFLSKDANGIWVLDQYKDRRGNKIPPHASYYKFNNPQSDGTLTRNADTYYTILTN
jgi:hypothetical protein